MARRATSLGPKPSLFVICFVCFLVFCFVFLGGFKGQVRWPKGPPHLALNPPCLFFLVLVFVFFCSFPFFVFNRKTLFFPLKRAFFVSFSVFLFLSPSTFFDLPPFSLSLSLSLSSLFLLLAFFLPSCPSFLLSFCFLFLSLFHFSFFFAFVFWKEQHENFNCYLFFHQSFLFFFLVSCLVFLSNPFSLSLFFFLILSYVFCSTWMFLVSKQTT